ncbi:Hypothetical Protein FCC1311_038852 [Hondaea fermentalgiana]|uniref:Uncharacterized protein n=1 Tax=Hondaea fermentalgiana TaxID=2315210 RepID=A0A2R5G9D1_9STRA|nr:Hypothetical Protein FCC1311_038852 [Hondaea fermentalgiana]|eukprot:GBG27662.1 Hypothetical Protein FCC1311_038852 [Hondaea fermentalgiana]
MDGASVRRGVRRHLDAGTKHRVLSCNVDDISSVFDNRNVCVVYLAIAFRKRPVGRLFDKDIKGGMVSLVDGEQHVLDFWASLSDREKACALMLSPETVRRCSRVAAYQIAGTDPRLCSWTMDIPDCVYEEWQGTVHRVMDATCADREKQGANQTFSGPSAAQANSPSGSARETLAELSRKHALVLVFNADAPTMAVLLLLKLQIKAAFETRKACAKVLNLLLLLSWEAALPLPVSIAVLLSILFFQSRCHDDIPWLRSLSEAFDWLVRSVFTSDPLEPMYIEWKSDAFVSAAFLLISSQHVAEAHWLVLTTGLIILPYVFGALEALPRQSRHNSEFARARFAAIRINKALLLYFGWSSWAMLIAAVFTFFPHDSLSSGDGVKDGESDSGSGSDGDDDSANDGDVDDTSNADSNGDGDGDGDINGNADAVGNGANDVNEIGRVNDDADGESIHAVERRSSRQVDMNVNIIE